MKIAKKISLGTFFLAFLMIGLFTKVNKAEAYTFTQTMRLGSTGGEVMELQRTLNTTNCKVSLIGAGAIGFETMYFGVLTDAAVKCFQASRGLTADGIVGPITRGSLNSLIVVVPPIVNLPPGCLPGYPFSSTTGQSCANPTLPAGCAPGYLFSATTGQPCNSTTPPQTNTGPLQGNSGSIESAVFISNLTNEEVGEGQNDVEVAGLRIEADNGSDIEITSVALNFSEGTATRNFDRYAEEVSIWLDGREVATVNADEFEDSNDFDKTVSLSSGAIIQRDQEEELVVKISGINNIDSADEGDTWTIEFESIRFRDADNVTNTENSIGDIGSATRTFSFENFATASDVELEIATTSSNPTSKIVLADDSNDTNNVLLISGEFRNNGDSDVELKELTARITPSGTADASEIASSYILIINGDEIETKNSNACVSVGDCDGTGANTAVSYVFNDIDIMLNANDDVSFEIRADINGVDGTTIAEGDSLTAFIDADNIIAEDESGDELGTGELMGTATGNEQVFYTVFPEITVTNKSISYVGSSTNTANVSFNVNIKAQGGTIYLNGDHEGTALKEAFQASVLGGNANTTLSALVYTPSGSYTVTNDGAEDEYFAITSGNTMTLVMSGSLTQTTTTVPAGAEIDSILFGTIATSDTTRSANTIDFDGLMNQLETSLLTLIGV